MVFLKNETRARAGHAGAQGSAEQWLDGTLLRNAPLAETLPKKFLP
jgi:hypothetical protein